MTSADELARRTLRELRTLSRAQRDIVVEEVLRADPELAPVLPDLLRLYGAAKMVRRLGPLRRDSVG